MVLIVTAMLRELIDDIRFGETRSSLFDRPSTVEQQTLARPSRPHVLQPWQQRKLLVASPFCHVFQFQMATDASPTIMDVFPKHPPQFVWSESVQGERSEYGQLEGVARRDELKSHFHRYVRLGQTVITVATSSRV